MNAFELANRDLRQRRIVPPERIADVSAAVIGVGAIGRQVALQLAAMGVGTLQLVDPDRVDVVNLATQGWSEEDLGGSKVARAALACRKIHSGLKVEIHACRYVRSLDLGEWTFCCVDAIDARRVVWNGVRDRSEFFVDGRMSAETLRVLTAWDEPSRAHYPTTLFRASEAYAGSCTAKSTIFCANVAAGLMLAQFARRLRGLPADADLSLNLLTSELSVEA